VLQILGHPEFLEERRADLELLTLLVSFGDGS
jgi:hypothetical protein